MKSSLKKKATHPVHRTATGFVQTMHFDLDFNYLGGHVEQVSIAADGSDNWESETCNLIPHVRYDYTRVSQKKLEVSRSNQALIKQAKEKVKYFATLEEGKGSVLRIVKNTIVTKLQPNIKAVSDVTLYYLERSFDSLNSDVIASERKTREMPSHLKEIGKEASKKSDSTSKSRRVK